MPPLAPIARKRGRPPKLHAAASLPLQALEKNRVNLADATTVRQKGKSPPTVQPTVPPATPSTRMPSVTNRHVSETVEKAVAPPEPESSDARRVSIRTTKEQPPIRFGHSGYVAFLIAILFLFFCERRQGLAYTFVEQRFPGERAYIGRSGALAPVGARDIAQWISICNCRLQSITTENIKWKIFVWCLQLD